MMIAAPTRFLLGCASALLLAGCQGDDAAEHAVKTRPFSDIAPSEAIYFVGTEPFWSGQIEGAQLRFTTPEHPEGTVISVSRFAGNHGLGFSGALAGQPFDLTITPGVCSDEMSDKVYPLTSTLRLGEDIREGCAWSDAHPAALPAGGASASPTS